MKIIKVMYVAAAISTAMFVSGAWCAETKIAAVDMGRVMKAFNDTKSAESFLEKQVEEFEAEQKDMIAERDKLRKDFESARESAKDKALSDKERESKMDIAEERLNALRDCELKIRDKVNQRQKEISDHKIRLQRRIVGKLREIIAKYAVEKNITLVLDSSAVAISGVDTVVYSKESLDITEDVLKVINVAVPEKSEKSGKPEPADRKK